MGSGGTGLQVSGDLAAFEGAVQQWGNEAIAEEGDLGSLFLFGWEWAVLILFHSVLLV